MSDKNGCERSDLDGNWNENYNNVKTFAEENGRLPTEEDKSWDENYNQLCELLDQGVIEFKDGEMIVHE